MSGEPENLILELLRGLRGEVADVKSGMASKSDLNFLQPDVTSGLHSLRADIASDLLLAEAKNETSHKHTREQIVGLRRAVVE